MRVQSLLVPTALAALASAQYYESYFEGDIAAREAYPEQIYEDFDVLAARDFEELQAREAEPEPYYYNEEDFANALIARDPEAFDALVELYARDAYAAAEAEAEAAAKEEKKKHHKHKHGKKHKKHHKHKHGKKHKKHHKHKHGKKHHHKE